MALERKVIVAAKYSAHELEKVLRQYNEYAVVAAVETQDGPALVLEREVKRPGNVTAYTR